MIKLTAILMLLGCLHLSARSYGQEITLSKKNAALQEVFLDIYKQTGYFFYCSDSLLLQAKRVTIQVKQASLDSVLALCFRDQPLTYSISDHVIIVKALGQPAKTKPIPVVRGRVVDEKGEPVAGVTISVKGTKTAVSTDANGVFILKGADEKAILIFTSANMETVELPLHGRSELLVALKNRVSGLQDVVINKGYYNSSRRMNTGSVSVVKAADIEKQPVSNPLEALEGRMTGVYIQQTSGVSGSGFNIEIRGRNSLRNSPSNNGNLPLYIVDAVPVSSTSLDQNSSVAGQIAPQLSPLNSINPWDIESIEILKDADATAIYGSRGANGVVLITTKKGRPGKTKVDISAYTGAGKVARMMKLLNSRQYLQMRHEAFFNDGAEPQDYDYDLSGSWDSTRYSDWQKILIGGTSGTSNVQASLSGGSLNTQFLLSGNYFRQTTVFPGDFADQKGSAHLSLNHSSENKKLTASVAASFTADNNNLPTADPTGSALSLAPVAPPVYQTDGSLNWAGGTWQGFTNPFAVFRQPYSGKTYNLVSNAVLGYQLLEGLQIKASLGFTDMEIQQSALVPISAQDPAYSPTGYGNYSSNGYHGWIIEPQAEYQKALFNGRLTMQVGSTFQQNVSQTQALFAYGYSSDALLNNMLAAPHLNTGAFVYANYKYNALFGRVNYAWKDRYLINITGRRDGSSRFGPGKQFANFGAIGLGWIFSSESFFKKSLPWLSYGKLRGSYGTTGNDQIGDYGYLDTYAPTTFPYNGTGGLMINRLFNPDYAWETSTKAEGSLEAGFLKDRIMMTLSYYRNQSSNQLVGYPLPTITGQASLPFFNLPATVRNTGWEFELTTTNITSGNLKWSTSLNLTFPKNVLLAYPGIEKSSYANTYTVGKSLYIRKGFHYTGVDPQTGVYAFTDVDKDGSISYPNDLLALKEIARTFYGGISNTISYGHFQLDFFFQFVKQAGFNYLNSFQSPGTISNQPSIVLDRWKQAKDEASSQRFSQDYGGSAFAAYLNNQNSDHIISDASFIRLKNLSLSYRLSSKLLSKSDPTNVRLYIQGQNLITITHYPGLDPESQSFQSLPPLKTLTGGIQITL